MTCWPFTQAASHIRLWLPCPASNTTLSPFSHPGSPQKANPHLTGRVPLAGGTSIDSGSVLSDWSIGTAPLPHPHLLPLFHLNLCGRPHSNSTKKSGGVQHRLGRKSAHPTLTRGHNVVTMATSTRTCHNW